MDPAIKWLVILTGYVGIAILSLFAIAVVLLILWGKIDLTKLISEADGSASMSRFQFLVFTFVVGFALMLAVVQSVLSVAPGTAVVLPHLPGSLLGLIGISGGTYAVSKGIQKSNETALKGQDGSQGDKITIAPGNPRA
jgi:hypothetical protein